MCAVLSGDTRLYGAADEEAQPAGLHRRLYRFPYYHPWKIFNLNSLVMILYILPYILDQVMKLDGHFVRSDTM